MEKTKYEKVAQVETSMALPKTLQAETQLMPMGGAEIAMFPVYGLDMTDRRIWVATFLDRDEAVAWIQASKVFGRPVNGAVIAKQESANGEAANESVAEDATGSAAGRDSAETLN